MYVCVWELLYCFCYVFLSPVVEESTMRYDNTIYIYAMLLAHDLTVLFVVTLKGQQTSLQLMSQNSLHRFIPGIDSCDVTVRLSRQAGCLQRKTF